MHFPVDVSYWSSCEYHCHSSAAGRTFTRHNWHESNGFKWQVVLTQKILRNVRSNLQGSAKCEPPRACTMTRNTIAAKRESQAFLGKFKKTFKRSEVSCAEQMMLNSPVLICAPCTIQASTSSVNPCKSQYSRWSPVIPGAKKLGESIRWWDCGWLELNW